MATTNATRYLWIIAKGWLRDTCVICVMKFVIPDITENSRVHNTYGVQWKL